jgi:hypothetical protein
MTAPSAIPCSVAREATSRAAELGIQDEFEQMLDRALQCIPNLRRVEVGLREPVEIGDDRQIVIDAFVPYREGEALNPGDDSWAEWVLRTFPAAVWRQVVLLLWDEPAESQ